MRRRLPPRPPVILIGMHRSGTTLLARMLDALGLFVGWRQAANHEAHFFNKLNSWLLAAAGGRWDTPAAIDYLLADRPGRELATAYLRDRLASPAAVEFLGPGRTLRYRSLLGIGEPWGWKDPRSTVTLDLWRELFPGARVIHLVRHGVDVAESLCRRQLAGRDLGRRNFERYRPLFRWVAKRGWFGTSPRLTHREEGLRLWEEYLSRAARSTADLGDRLLELRYESLLRRPREVTERALAFCGLEPPPAAVEAQLRMLRSDRALAFAGDPELVDFWHRHRRSPWMERYGYDRLDPEI